jgi:hypothetical protein
MNRTLIGVLDSLNTILAILIIVVSTLAGFAGSHMAGSGIVGAILGLLAGIMIAAIFCGVLATLIEIEKHLRTIASGKVSTQSALPGWPSAQGRNEPTL